jgi:hypothetical protein
MKGPIAAVVVASTLLGFSSGAWAEKRKVVVEQFSGPSSDRFRQSVMSALGKMVTVEVIADKKVANVEADLGVVEVSENYSGVAGALKASAFVGGTVTGKKPRAKLTVHNAKGAVVGEQSWSAANPAKLIAAINADISDKLASFLSAAAGGGGGDEAPPVAKAKKQEKEKEEKDEPVAKRKSDDDESSSKSERSERASKAESEEKSDSDTEVRASARHGSSGGMEFGIAFVMRVFTREFAYNQKVEGTEQGYSLPAAPAPGLAIEFFPVSVLGFTLNGNYALVGSKDNPMGKAASTYKTTAYSWSVGAKGRFPISSFVLEPDVGYGMNVFKVEDFTGSASNGIDVAGVDYKHVRVGGGVRIPFGDMSISVGGHYLHVLDAGQILSGPAKMTSAGATGYFAGKVMGGEGFAEFAMPLSFAKGFEARLGADIRRMAYTFDVLKSDLRSAGGATDQYLGFNLSVGYRTGL